MNPLCAIGLHRRIRDRDVATRWLIFSHIDEYVCLRCRARWERVTLWVGGDLEVMWERVA